jgi:hypothetical protein
MEHRVPLTGAMTTRNFEDILSLLDGVSLLNHAVSRQRY